MAKRPARRGSRPYDDDDFQDNDMMENLEAEEEDDDFDDEEFEDYLYSAEEDEERPRKRPRKKAAASASASRKRTSESTANKEVRLKAFWGVYSQNMQCVETFEYAQKEAAFKKAAELQESKKMLFFVKLEKKVIES
ncbi:MAG: hypothetical protein IJD43_14485 [Thermoguttaceae bacterium]|nr:hypothetical protein [Planctomycetaceae bacterium]MBQ4144673.1 hypothetical protein [Thermoguttaceae bacterium]